MMYEPLKSALPHVQSVKAAGVEFAFFRESLDRTRVTEPTISKVQIFGLESRARLLKAEGKLLGASILWVDDLHPVQNTWERRALQAVGVLVDTATDTEQALKALASSS